MLGMTLAEVRPYLGDFESKRYTNPTLMDAILRRLGVGFRTTAGRPRVAGWPRYGLARVQWGGPWLKPGVPMAARYRWTHWVGSCWSDQRQEQGVFDINALGNGTGWCRLGDWEGIVVPWLLKQVAPRADGTWYITHSIELERRE